MADFRKHPAWYFKGFPLGGELRHAFGMVTSLDDLDELLAKLDPDVPYPAGELGKPRGRQGTVQRVNLPEGWLDDRCGLEADLTEAELDISGG